MEDEDSRIWIGVHFGSRGFGHKTASGFLALAQGLPFEGRAHEGEMDSPPVLLEVGSELGEAYVSAMELAGEYAYAGRDVVVAKVLEILGAEAVYEVHNHHNFAWREEHFGRSYWVIRKGCTPARPGQAGFVGGSMGDESVILEGVESSENEHALCSTVHGAGRVMRRSAAAGRSRRRRRRGRARRAPGAGPSRRLRGGEAGNGRPRKEGGGRDGKRRGGRAKGGVRRAGPGVVLSPPVIPEHSPAGARELQADHRDQQHPDEH